MDKPLLFLMAIPTLLLCFWVQSADNKINYTTSCENLRLGQYMCPDPDPKYEYIDRKTQQPKNCTKENLARGKCVQLVQCIIVTLDFLLQILNRILSG